MRLLLVLALAGFAAVAQVPMAPRNWDRLQESDYLPLFVLVYVHANDCHPCNAFASEVVGELYHQYNGHERVIIASFDVSSAETREFGYQNIMGPNNIKDLPGFLLYHGGKAMTYGGSMHRSGLLAGLRSFIESHVVEADSNDEV